MLSHVFLTAPLTPFARVLLNLRVTPLGLTANVLPQRLQRSSVREHTRSYRIPPPAVGRSAITVVHPPIEDVNNPAQKQRGEEKRGTGNPSALRRMHCFLSHGQGL